MQTSQGTLGRNGNSKLIRLYASVLCLCVLAFSLGLWNRLAHGHWFLFGQIVNLIVALSMATLLRRELRRGSN